MNPSPDRRRLAVPETLILAISVALVWFLAWAHPLYPPDEGRFGSAAATMVDTGNWLVPEFRGRAHLTKPPLTYWLQAIGVHVFGRTELAVRWPALLATSLAQCCLFWFARRTLGTRPALVAVAVAAVMPSVLIVGRLANTDAMLACAWLIALASGFLMIERRLAAMPAFVLFWTAMAAGFLTKGAAGFGPLIVLAAWCVLGRRARDLARLHAGWGLPLALVPLGVWIAAVTTRHPDIGQVWWEQTIGRVTGTTDLSQEPWWFYVPVFLGGMYPATVMLVLPVFNLGFRDAWRAVCGGDLRALLLVAVILPFLGFSLSRGKLPTYLLPLAAPTAMLVAITLKRWLRGEYDEVADRARTTFVPPDVRRTLAIVAVLVFVAQLGAAIYAGSAAPELWALMLPLAIAPLGCIVLWRLWNDRQQRERGLAIAWVGLVLSWTIIFGIETRYTTMMGSSTLLSSLRTHFGVDQPTIVTVSFHDPTIAFYNGGQPTRDIGSLNELRGLRDVKLPAIVLMQQAEMTELLDGDHGVAGHLEPFGTWTKWFAVRVKIFVLNVPPSELPHP